MKYYEVTVPGLLSLISRLRHVPGSNQTIRRLLRKHNVSLQPFADWWLGIIQAGTDVENEARRRLQMVCNEHMEHFMTMRSEAKSEGRPFPNLSPTALQRMSGEFLDPLGTLFGRSKSWIKAVHSNQDLREATVRVLLDKAREYVAVSNEALKQLTEEELTIIRASETKGLRSQVQELGQLRADVEVLKELVEFMQQQSGIQVRGLERLGSP